jgi:hypothetical protein
MPRSQTALRFRVRSCIPNLRDTHMMTTLITFFCLVRILIIPCPLRHLTKKATLKIIGACRIWTLGKSKPIHPSNQPRAKLIFFVGTSFSVCSVDLQATLTPPPSLSCARSSRARTLQGYLLLTVFLIAATPTTNHTTKIFSAAGIQNLVCDDVEP